jgi:Zn finger protein HypA/HybF involved in hydrogenase expression
MESQKFRFSNIAHNYTRSDEISSFAKASIPVGVRAADAKCNVCGHAWRAPQGADDFVAAINAIFVTCPACGADETIPTTQFIQSA